VLAVDSSSGVNKFPSGYTTLLFEVHWQCICALAQARLSKASLQNRAVPQKHDKNHIILEMQ
jgi:hypothetical protein